jgi:threonine dehydrogenase-like Zn-dependent dehydrogenase
MPSDLATAATPSTRPPEPAQLVWERALTVTGRRWPLDRFEVALDLLRTANNDPTTMAHARTIGRTHLRANPGDAGARRGIRVLDTAIASLGAKPRQ